MLCFNRKMRQTKGMLGEREGLLGGAAPWEEDDSRNEIEWRRQVGVVGTLADSPVVSFNSLFRDARSAHRGCRFLIKRTDSKCVVVLIGRQLLLPAVVPSNCDQSTFCLLSLPPFISPLLPLSPLPRLLCLPWLPPSNPFLQDR